MENHNMYPAPNEATMINIVWKSGWYASRLHAVPRDVVFPPGRMATVKSLCGTSVYNSPPREWAQRKLERGIPQCEHCKRILLNLHNEA